MIFTDIQNEKIKVSKNSITVLSENGKTKGVVRNVTPFLSLQANKQINFSKKLRDCGIWGNPERIIQNTFIMDGVIYQLRNMKTFDYYTNERKERENAFYSNLSAYGVVVLNVFLN